MSQVLHIRKDIFKTTQADFASIAGVSQATVSRWEKGEWEPNRNELQRIRDVAIERGLSWDDRLFFEQMPSSQGDAA